jgi:hypothetical protein
VVPLGRTGGPHGGDIALTVFLMVEIRTGNHTLACNKSNVVAQKSSLLAPSQTTFILLASIIEHRHTKQTYKQTKNNASIKSKL